VRGRAAQNTTAGRRGVAVRGPALRLAGAGLIAAVAVLVAACGGGEAGSATTATVNPPGSLPQGAEHVVLDPSDFTTRIDNPWFPLSPGSVWTYEDREATGPPGRDVMTVTDRTKVVAGITARVVHDRATRGSEIVEDTFDWFAQDGAGNVWYLGEATHGYKNGRPASSGGSWEAGVDGAEAGIIMPAGPVPGLQYRQEHRKGEAEDQARVLSVDDQAQSPAGHFDHALLTKEFSPLEREDLEYKLYAKGVGLVLALGVSGDLAQERLVSYRKGGG
jgi:hypothetical protein